jgi:hypothetical protein
MPGFKVYTGEATHARRGVTVTVMQRGYLGFSKGAWAATGSPAVLRFLLDSDRPGIIGFQPCETGEPGARRLTPDSHVVTARALLKELGRSLSTPARRYPLHLEDGQPPYIDLDEDVPGNAGAPARPPRGGPAGASGGGLTSG